MYDARTGRFSAGTSRNHLSAFICAPWRVCWLWLGLCLVPLDFLSAGASASRDVGYASGSMSVIYPITITYTPSGSWIFQYSSDGVSFSNLTSGQTLSYNAGSATWSGLPVGTGNWGSTITTTTALPNQKTYYFRSRNASTGVIGSGVSSVTLIPPAFNLTVTSVQNGTSAPASATLDPFLVNLGTAQTIPAAPVVTDPYPPVPVAGPFDDWAGKDLAVPYYVPAGQNSLDVEIGGKTYNFPVTTQPGDSGGVAMLKLPIPAKWDGTAKIGGQTVNLGARTAYTGNPSMQLYSNPYQTRESLPAGMSWGVPSLPSGMTVGNALPLPSGMTAVSVPLSSSSSSAPPVKTVDSSGAIRWTTPPTITPTTTTTPGGGSTVKAGTVEGSTNTGTDAADAAIADASWNAVSTDGQAVSDGLKNYATTWDGLKGKIAAKMDGFRMLADGSIPRENTLAFDLPLGPFGQRSVSLDLSQAPFSVARQISLCFVMLHAGWFFIRYIKV